MNVVPGSSFFQTVNGSAASAGAVSGGPVQSAQPASHTSSATEHHRPETRNAPVPQELRAGPPGTNVNLVV